MSSKKWALVLAGGGGKGIAHVGVLKALEELGYFPSLVAGTSMGAVMGACFCCGMTSLDIHQFLIRFDLKDYINIKTIQLPGTGGINKVYQVGQVLKNFMFTPGIDSGDKIEQLLFQLTEGRSFLDLNIPFICNAVDLISGKNHIFSEGLVAEAIRASLSLPGIFVPKQIDAHYFVDGGIYDNLLVYPARKAGYRRILSVSLDPEGELSPDQLKSGVDVIAASMMINESHRRKKMSSLSCLNINAWPGTPISDFAKIEEKIEIGYERTMNRRDKIHRLLG